MGVALKRKAIDRGEYEEAKAQKEEIEAKREAIYREHNVSDLLELTGKVKLKRCIACSSVCMISPYRNRALIRIQIIEA